MADNNLVLFPDFAQADNTPITAAEYITVYVWSACLDPNRYPDNWRQHNTITFAVSMDVAGTSLTFPIYSDYQAGNTERLATNQQLLIGDAPCNGKSLGLSARVFRSDRNDFVPTIIGLLSGASTNPALTTYASTAIPAIQLAGVVAGQVYNTFFPQHGDTIIDTQKATLVTNGVGKALLRNCFMLLYYGSDNIDDNTIMVLPNGEVSWKTGAPNPLRSGSWILFAIRGSEARADQNTRPWDQKFNLSIHEFSGVPGTDPSRADQEFSDAYILLRSDPDITILNAAAIYDSYGRAFVAAKAAYSGGHHAAVADAIRASMTEMKVPMPVRGAGLESITVIDAVSLVQRLDERLGRARKFTSVR